MKLFTPAVLFACNGIIEILPNACEFQRANEFGN